MNISVEIGCELVERVLRSRADRRGVASLSYREISAETGLSRRVVRGAVASLSDRRLIYILPRFDEDGGQLANAIHILPARRGVR